MAKKRLGYACASCGNMSHKWMGKCSACGEWDTLEAVATDDSATKDPHRGLASGWREHDENGSIESVQSPIALPIAEAGAHDGPIARLVTGISELDRVLGGGIVPGSVILLGGDPGIGKSTLALQALGSLARTNHRTLYVTSEESGEQVRLRAERLHVGTTGTDDDELFVLADTNLARIVEQARQVRPDVLVIDSIQMIYKSDLDASPGSVAQLRRCCTELVYLAKASGMSVILIGHVTKEGALAGPKLLEHLVDVVLSFEGDRYHAHRIVRAIKNRFGTTMEIGLFAMEQRGLVEVPDGASVAADALGESPRPGSAVTPHRYRHTLRARRVASAHRHRFPRLRQTQELRAGCLAPCHVDRSPRTARRTLTLRPRCLCQRRGWRAHRRTRCRPCTRTRHRRLTHGAGLARSNRSRWRSRPWRRSTRRHPNGIAMSRSRPTGLQTSARAQTLRRTSKGQAEDSPGCNHW